jgi:hypothetical protein
MSSEVSRLRAYAASGAGEWTAAAALLLVFVGLAWLQRVPSITTESDDSMYILLSESLRDGGFRSIHLVNAPVHTKFPPLFPALLAAVASVAGESTDAFAAMNIGLTVLALVFIFAVARRRWPPPVALGALAIVASSPPLQTFTGAVASEPAFLAFTALTLWVLAGVPLTTGRAAGACACASLAALTRTVGGTLILAVVGLLLLERRWRLAAAFTGIVGAAVLGAAFWLRAHGMPGPAAEYIAEAVGRGQAATANPIVIVARRVIINGPEYAGQMLWLLSFPTVRGTLLEKLVWLSITSVALAVGVWLLWRRWRIAALFLLIYGALLLAWQWAVWRFLLPVLPLLSLAILAGVDALVAKKWNRRVATAAVVALTALTTVTGLTRSAQTAAVKRGCDRERPMRSASCFNADQLSFFEAARYVAAHTPPSAVAMSSKEPTFHYLTRRRIVPVDSLNARTPERAEEFLQRSGVSYVILGHLSHADPPYSIRLRSACHRLRPEREFPPRTTVFRVVPATEADPRACEILRAYARHAGQFRSQIF